jgi:hypothetical protein
MKRTFLSLVAAGIFAAALPSPATAQEGGAPAPAAAPAKDPMVAKYEEKLAEAWFKDGGWTDDYDAARAKAKETGKPIFAYFSRSYSP